MSSNPARFYVSLPAGAVRCDLCPRHCVIGRGGSGWCKARCNEEGELLTLAYARPAAVAIDPIEKKPLMNFLPGTQTLSFGAFGCNLDCCFCQNSSLSHGVYNASGDWRVVARPAGVKTVLVTNGFIEPEAARELYGLVDAANIDVKGFSEEFYKTMCCGSLEPVKTACEIFKNEAGGHLELTNLVIPGKNDSPRMIEEYLDWVESALGLDTPLHFNAYFPAYHYRQSPRTPASLLHRIGDRARERGFQFVQLGNI